MALPKILISIDVDSDADLLLQLLEGHLGALALRRRPLAVHVDGGAPAMRVGRVNEIRDKSRDWGHVSENEAGSGGKSSQNHLDSDYLPLHTLINPTTIRNYPQIGERGEEANNQSPIPHFPHSEIPGDKLPDMIFARIHSFSL